MVQTRYPEQYASIFRFSVQNFFFDISNCEGRTGERKVSMVQTRYPEEYASIFVFRIKIFSSIS